MSAVDSVQGYNAYLFKLKNDLEIRSRRDGVQLGLFRPAAPAMSGCEVSWDKAFYQAAPTEEKHQGLSPRAGPQGLGHHRR
jgi:hypothetical protein